MSEHGVFRYESNKLFQYEILSVSEKHIFFISSVENSSLICSHIEKIEKGIGFDFLIFSGVVMCIFGSLVVSFITNWKLSLIVLCVIPICIGSSSLFAKVTKDYHVINDIVSRLIVYC